MLGRHDAFESIRVEVGGRELQASLAVPQGPVGVVIFAKTDRARDHVAEALRARGLATVECELLGDDENEYDIELAATRLLAITDWIVERSNVAHLPIGYLGARIGAAATLVAAARRPELIRAIVSRGGRADLAGAALPIVRAPTLLIACTNDDSRAEIDREVVDQMTACTQLAVIPGDFDDTGVVEEIISLTSEWLVDHFAQAVQEPVAKRGSWGRQFRDRRCAGERLAQLLQRYEGEDVVVCGLPRGGVVIADEIAKQLDAALDVWLVRKIGMPIQPELGMGALAEGAALVLDSTNIKWSGATPEDLRKIVHGKAEEIRRRAKVYRDDGDALDVHGKTVILVDEGVATAGTLRAAIRGARKRGAARVVVAAPVIAAEALDALEQEADEVVCLATPRHLIAVGAWYQDFRKPGQDDVVAILTRARDRFAARHAVRAGA
jgi:predicted phosphoribosyltransferase